MPVRKLILLVAISLLGILILFLMWHNSTYRMVKLFTQGNSFEQSRAIHKLDERLTAGRLSKNYIDKIMNIILEHLEKRTPILEDELYFGWNALGKGLVSQEQKMRFLNGIISPSCQYHIDQQVPFISFQGDAFHIPSGLVCQYQLSVYAIDGKETEQKIMEKYIIVNQGTATFGTKILSRGSHGLSFATFGDYYTDLNPSESLSLRLRSTWYSAPVELIGDLPLVTEKPQEFDKIRNILEMDSVKKICEYSKTAELLKSKNWKSYF
jgi:hypothetical protein